MALNIALDTNRYVDLCAGDETTIDIVSRAQTVSLPFVVLAELRAGFAVGTRGRENERVLARFLRKPGVGLLFASDVTTRMYASLYRQLREQGTPIPTNDLWIAALATEHQLSLCTRDRHFSHLPQLDVV